MKKRNQMREMGIRLERTVYNNGEHGMTQENDWLRDLLAVLDKMDESRKDFCSEVRTKFRKKTYRRVPMHLWTAINLEELAQVRGVPLGTLAAEILEQVSNLWQHNATDHSLFLKRVENPAEADVVIDSKPEEGWYAVSVDTSEAWDRTSVVLAIRNYLKVHEDPGFITDLLEELENE